MSMASFDPKEIQAGIEKMTKAVIDQTLAYTSARSMDMINEARREIDSRIKTPVLHIQINASPVKQLASPAVPFLGRMITNAKIGLNTLLVGAAGCGKTFSAAQLAEALDLPFGHLCLTAGASETWLFGRQTPNGFIEGVFSKLYREGGVFLADELDAADPNLLLSINTALANGTMYNPISGVEIKRHENFVFIGACNTFGKGANHIYTGRNRLDAATLDRFVTIQVDYNEMVEEMLCPDNEIRLTLQLARRQLKDRQSEEIISTRAIQAAYKQNQAGVDMAQIFTSLTLSWPAETAKVVFDSHTQIRKELKKR